MIGKYFHIYRPFNIFFIALAQALGAYFLDFTSTTETFAYSGIGWLVLGTAACAAFGNWVNDFLDIDRDFINKSNPSFVRKLNPKLVYIHLLVFVSIALYSGNVLGVWFITLFAGSIILLFLYSKFLKDMVLVGNMAIAVLCFLSIYSIIYLHLEPNLLLVWHFAGLAAALTIIREIVKDAEDTKGDIAASSKTFPIKYGKNTTNMFVYALLLFTTSFTMFSVYYQKCFFEPPLLYVYYAYYVLFVLVPLYYLSIEIRSASKKEDYTQASQVLKYVLIVGILSIMFF